MTEVQKRWASHYAAAILCIPLGAWTGWSQLDVIKPERQHWALILAATWVLWGCAMAYVIVATAPWNKPRLGRRHLWIARAAPWIILAFGMFAIWRKWS